MRESVIDQLADTVKRGDICDETLRKIIVKNLSALHRQVYRLLQNHGAMSSAELRTLHGSSLSPQQVSNILKRLVTLGVIDREPMRGHGGMYTYRVVSARESNGNVGVDGSANVVGEQRATTP